LSGGEGQERNHNFPLGPTTQDNEAQVSSTWTLGTLLTHSTLSSIKIQMSLFISAHEIIGNKTANSKLHEGLIQAPLLHTKQILSPTLPSWGFYVVIHSLKSVFTIGTPLVSTVEICLPKHCLTWGSNLLLNCCSLSWKDSLPFWAKNWVYKCFYSNL
jgi:hypothetical protein